MQKYFWIQDLETVTLEILKSNIIKSNFEVTIYDLFIQITDKKNKQIERIDLPYKVKIKEFCNFQYQDSKIQIYLEKQEPKIWNTFSLTLSKEEKKQQRKESIKNREVFLQSLNEIQKEKQKQIKENIFQQKEQVEKNEKQFKEEAKNFQKEEKIKEIFQNEEKQEYFYQNQNDEFENFEQKKQTILNQEEKQKILSNIKMNEIDYNIRNENENIINLPFTQKPHANLAMREKYISEPNIKNKKISGKDFLWLHDKGNDFLKNNDFESALNAFNEVIKIQKDFLPSLANLSLIFLRQFKLEESLKSCEQILQIFQEQDENFKNLTKNREIILIIEKRIIYIHMLQGKLEKFIIKKKNSQIEKEISFLTEKDKQLINLRIESNKLKKKGDYFYIKEKFDQAIENYLIIQQKEEKNEKVLSNLASCYIKKGLWKEGIEVIQKLLEYISPLVFLHNLEKCSESKLKDFIVKNLMKKIKCEMKLNFTEEIQKSLKMLQKIDSQNKYSKIIQKQIEDKNKMQEYLLLKEQFNILIKEENFQECLNNLQKCLEIISFEKNPIDYLKILLNKTVLYLKQGKFSECLIECNKGLKKLEFLEQNNQNKKIKKIYQQNLKQIKKIEILFLLRRSKSFINDEQKIQGKEDLLKILTLDANNEEVKKILKDLNQFIFKQFYFF